MSEWKPIEEAPENPSDVLVWNGERVCLAWLADDGWHDSTNQDHRPLDPQPTHWMPLPAPPE